MSPLRSEEDVDVGRSAAEDEPGQQQEPRSTTTRPVRTAGPRTAAAAEQAGLATAKNEGDICAVIGGALADYRNSGTFADGFEPYDFHFDTEDIDLR